MVILSSKRKLKVYVTISLHVPESCIMIYRTDLHTNETVMVYLVKADQSFKSLHIHLLEDRLHDCISKE